MRKDNNRYTRWTRLCVYPRRVTAPNTEQKSFWSSLAREWEIRLTGRNKSVENSPARHAVFPLIRVIISRLLRDALSRYNMRLPSKFSSPEIHTRSYSRSYKTYFGREPDDRKLDSRNFVKNSQNTRVNKYRKILVMESWSFFLAATVCTNNNWNGIILRL